ncbi:alpha-2-macroglobulin-P-like isoform X2 [Xenia sp. Carnegie-2017]|uniref:alpha-2-macroglobulin-P-like isoform X2 n=1 Tax=Xenia sp. Carnegie-2017 TaxID=2897299 RepID=UPI001F0354AD|nr:alpha-2-macroglobulin-P-like isoform X2 [Xenia sp. Carnegie-2017]
MRIISLDEDLKLKGERVDKVYVTASSTRIKQWNNITMEDGLASLEMQLSKEPVEGDYKITAIVGKKTKVRKIIVKKYVLPKFEVKITPPSYIALDQKNFDTKICAKYTYGKNMRGILNVQICLKHEKYDYTNGWGQENLTKPARTLQKRLTAVQILLQHVRI